MSKTSFVFHVSGIHCASCKILIEDALSECDGITNVQVDVGNKTVSLDSSVIQDEAVLAELATKKIQDNGYVVSVQKTEESKQKTFAWESIPIGLGFLILFFLLQKSGVLNVGIGGGVTPVSAFLIGLIASVSSCLAVVGGLVLSLSAKVSQEKNNSTRTFTLFHIGRFFSFSVLGGLLGSLGFVVGINLTVTTVLGIIAALVMIVLGLNLVGVIEKNPFMASSSVFTFFKRKKYNELTPAIIGFATFFLPCGFTQSMQVSALSSGSFLSGFLIMGSFAVGTFPVLALITFGSVSVARGSHAQLFFKSAGVVVIGLGVFALLSGLVALGILNPLFTL